MSEFGVVDFEGGGEVFGEGFCWFAGTLNHSIGTIKLRSWSEAYLCGVVNVYVFCGVVFSLFVSACICSFVEEEVEGGSG